MSHTSNQEEELIVLIMLHIEEIDKTKPQVAYHLLLCLDSPDCVRVEEGKGNNEYILT